MASFRGAGGALAEAAEHAAAWADAQRSAAAAAAASASAAAAAAAIAGGDQDKVQPGRAELVGLLRAAIAEEHAVMVRHDEDFSPF